MTEVRERGGRPPSEDDVAYLRAALKPFDPADGPFTATTPHHRSHLEPSGPRRRRTGLLVATAAAVVGTVLVPTVLLNRSPDPVAAQRNAGQDLADCRQRVAAAATKGVTAGEGNTTEAAPPPSLPWYSPTKAAQLTAVLRGALPAESCVFPGSGFGDLRFTDDSSMSFQNIDGPAPTATGTLVTTSGIGNLMVSVYRARAGSGSCVSGDVDRTFTAADGTVISQKVSSATYEGTRSIVLLVQAYRPAGDCVWMRQTDEVLRSDSDPNTGGTIASGATPLTMEELSALASAPGLDTTS